MAETTIVSAAKAASAQKSQQNAKFIAAIENCCIPTFVKPVIIELIGDGILFESDLERLTGDPNAKYEPNKRRRGRPQKEVTEFPESFPEQTGITSYDALFDERTKAIMMTAAIRILDSDTHVDYADMISEMWQKLPSKMMSFKAKPGDPESRYKFISTAVNNIANTFWGKRKRERERLPCVSLEEHLDSFGELTLENVIIREDHSTKDRNMAETLEELVRIFPKLDKRDQAILIMKTYFEMSFREIAERFGVVKNEIHYRMTVAIPAMAIRASREA